MSVGTPSYRDQMAITEYLLDQLERTLAGRDEPECLDRLPADNYHLAVIAPMRNPGGDQPDEPAPPDLSPSEEQPPSRRTPPRSRTSQSPPNESDDRDPDEENDGAERLRREDLLTRSGAPSAIGAEFVVELPAGDVLDLTCDVRFAIYTRRFPTYEQQLARYQLETNDAIPATPSVGPISQQGSISIRERFVRHPIVVENIPLIMTPDTRRKVFNSEINTAVQAVLDAESTRADIWRTLPRSTIPRSAMGSEEVYRAALARFNQMPLDLPPLAPYLDVRTARLPGGRVRVGVYLVNGTASLETSTANAARFLIDGQITLQINAGLLVPIEMVTMAEDYQYDPRIWAVGQGCATEVDRTTATIRTMGLARAELPRLATRNTPTASFASLVDNPLSVLRTIANAMQRYARDWEEELRNNTASLNPEMQQAARNDLDTFQDEIRRFQEGSAALEADDRLLRAFQGMHRVFERAGAGRGITSWRLFQIGFIVTQLPALAIREGQVESNILQTADVLWFPTGGGKTEAYLGLISCALLYDRLRGKHNGVTAWLRFPLRMLSVQQLQRAVRILYETEQERLTLCGSAAAQASPIGLGYFVGKSSTPNQLGDAQWLGRWRISELAARRELRDRLRLTRICPRCNQAAVEVEIDRTDVRIRHICQACQLDLQIFVSDDEIFRYLPSVLVGTVDKLPSVAWRTQFAHIWGGTTWRCPRHGFSSGRYCIVFGCQVPEANRTNISLYDPAPALQIQDELHLMKEDLGTFAGHYETLARLCAIDTPQGSQPRRLPPKILAATATVEGVDRQTRHLYGLPARRFPSRGPAWGESFYAQVAQDETQSRPRIARRYVAFRSSFLRSPEAATRVLEILHADIRRLYQQLTEEGANAVVTRVGFQDATGEGPIQALLAYYDTTLTYVNAKADGGRIKRVLDDVVGRGIPSAGERQLRSIYLTGESSIDEIAETVDAVERPPDRYDDNDRVDAVVGTSLISHGVDVSRFNLMCMAGMPGRTAEYIQASSRAGRTVVGIVIVALSPWLVREQSLFHRFTAYHANMDRLIEPVPINRFSRFAVRRTMPGMLTGTLLAIVGSQIRGDMSKVAAVTRAIDAGNPTESSLRQLVQRAYAVDDPIYAAGLRSALESGINERFRTEIRSLRAPAGKERTSDALTTKPMSSLRDVDPPVLFDPAPGTWEQLRWLDRR